ncbi:MAG: beta-N-acetylhexosaminidase [Verrucomicrobiota bacterium]|nr:beta-N-acetylhexosaminidase [Verrucomicrobiota bacterium]
MAKKNLSTLGQNFVVGLPKAELDLDTRTYLRAIRPGGIILFARNITSPAAVAELNAQVRDLLGKDVLICLDHEGGRVNRIKEFLGVIPSAQQLGVTGKTALAYEHGLWGGKVMRLLGFNWDLCPVVDLALKREVDNSVSDRTWSADPLETVAFAGAFAKGLLKEGVLPCGKHFPGYGAANKDPHFNLPLVDRTKKQLMEVDLVPYMKLAKSKLIPSIMIGHGHFPCFHKDPYPASISKVIIEGLLRKTLKYQGAVVTDDLEMGAITKMLPIEESAVKTLQAGSDLVLICHTPSIMINAFEAVEKAYKDGEISEKTIEISQKRVAKFKAMVPKSVKYSDKAFEKIKKDTARFTDKVMSQLPESFQLLQTNLSAVGEAYKK